MSRYDRNHTVETRAEESKSPNDNGVERRCVPVFFRLNMRLA